jgi:hypothetical protein
VNFAAALLLALALTDMARAATAYVTDELVLGVYAEQSMQGPRLATLHSGAMIETLTVNGESTEVRLADGTLGWVKSLYLTTSEPATVRLQHLQEELERSTAAADQADHGSVAQLRRGLANGSRAGSDAFAAMPRPWVWAGSLILALFSGFWLGYAVLARRVKTRFGGIKVY